jgi:hypothetical protein
VKMQKLDKYLYAGGVLKGYEIRLGNALVNS